jgi:NAD(P)-dependent dehydrogenase (short-subunit alcohol dehydrogenase family)
MELSQMDTKIVLITGANRGLGRSMAVHLAAHGWDVVGTYRSNEEEARTLAAEIEGRGRRAVMLRLDVARTDTFAAFADELGQNLGEKFGRRTFDALINNAGVGGHALAAETTEALFDELSAVHFKGPFFLTQRLLPMIVDGGRILNVSSGLARMTFPGAAAYAANKAAIETVTRYLAKELGPRRITANVIAPGAIATDFNGGRVRDNADLNKQVASMTALGRVGEADDIGLAVAALLSDGGRWISGQRIEVSGGQAL